MDKFVQLCLKDNNDLFMSKFLWKCANLRAYKWLVLNSQFQYENSFILRKLRNYSIYNFYYSVFYSLLFNNSGKINCIRASTSTYALVVMQFGKRAKYILPNISCPIYSTWYILTQGTNYAMKFMLTPKDWIHTIVKL